MISEILTMSSQIKDKRTPLTTFLHLQEEVGELSTELNIVYGISDKQPGKDGIVGEAIDAIICLTDIIYQVTNGKITPEQINAITNSKLTKWQKSTEKKNDGKS